MVRLRRAGLGMLVASTAACVPVINHGPVIDDGWRFHGAVGGTWGLGCDQVGSDCRPRWALGVANLEARYGEADAYSVGVQIPLLPLPSLWQFGALDVYVQLGDSSSVHAKGVGFYLQQFQMGPYIQFGRLDEKGRGWYTTQAVIWRRDRRYTDGPFPRPGVYWVPTISWSTLLDRPQDRIDTSSWLRPFLTVGLGYEVCTEMPSRCPAPGFGWWMGAGISVEVGPRLR